MESEEESMHEHIEVSTVELIFQTLSIMLRSRI